MGRAEAEAPQTSPCRRPVPPSPHDETSNDHLSTKKVWGVVNILGASQAQPLARVGDEIWAGVVGASHAWLMARGTSYRSELQELGFKSRGRRRLPVDVASMPSNAVSAEECKRQLRELAPGFDHVFGQLVIRGAEEEWRQRLHSAVEEARVEARLGIRQSAMSIGVDAALAAKRLAVEEEWAWKREIYGWLSEAKLKERRPRKLPAREARKEMGRWMLRSAGKSAGAAAAAADQAVEAVWKPEVRAYVGDALVYAACAYLWAGETEGAIEVIGRGYAGLRVLSWEQSRTGRQPILR